MTREEKLRRLHAELQAANDGVFIIGSVHAPGLGTPTMSLDQLLSDTDLGGQLRASAGQGPVEVLASRGISNEMLGSLNHRRDQLRIGRAILLVFDPSDCARVSTARGVIDPDRYAPALRPSDVVGPRSPLTAPPEDSDP